MSFQIGDKVFIPASANSYWTGEGVVTRLCIEDEYILVNMLTGRATGKTGGFEARDLRPAGANDSVMEIVSIKRTKHKDTGLKVYGQVLGESGKTYRFAYFRRKTFRGWICSCDNFMMSQFAKGLNCKHLQFVRNQVGRYAASVPKS
jgi:hypothetical protein